MSPGKKHHRHDSKELLEEITDADARREDECDAEADRFEEMFGDGGDEK